MQYKANIDVKLFVYFVRVELSVYFLDYLVFSFDLNAHFVRYFTLA